FESPHHRVGQSLDLDGEPRWIFLGIDARQAMGDQIKIRLGLSYRNARFEMRVHDEVALPGFRMAALQGLGYPQIPTPPRKPRRHDADKGTWFAVQPEGTAQYLGIEVVFLAPQLVTHNEDRRSARLAVIGRDAPAQQRRHSQEVEDVRRNICSLEALHAIATGVEDVFAGVPDHSLEDVVLFLIIQKFRDGIVATPPVIASLRIMDLESHNPARISVRKRIQENIVDNTENGCGRADAERQG